MELFFGEYLRKRCTELNLQNNELCNLLIQYDADEFKGLRDSSISRWMTADGSMPQPKKLKKIAIALGDDPSSLITRLRYTRKETKFDRVHDYVLQQISNLRYGGDVIGSFVAIDGHYWHDMTQNYQPDYTKSLLQVDQHLLTGDYHANEPQIAAWAQLPGTLYIVNAFQKQNYYGHLLALKLKPSVFDLICSGQKQDQHIQQEDIAESGSGYGLYIYSFHACNKATAAKFISLLLKTVASSRGRCLKIGGLTGTTEGAELAEEFGLPIGYQHQTESNAQNSFKWKGKRLIYAHYSASTFDFYQHLGPTVVTAIQDELTKHPLQIMADV